MSLNTQNSSGWKHPRLIKSIIGGVAVAATIMFFIFSGGEVFSKQQNSAETDKKAPATVEISKPTIKDITDSLSSVGTLLSNESVTISSEIAGKVTGIYFNEGQSVKSGQTLIRLDDSILRATLDSAQVDRALTESKYKRAIELSKAEAMSQQDRDSAYADWQRDEAAVRLAKAQLAKTEIKAPFSGTIGLRQVSLGNYLQAGATIVNLEDISRLKIQFNIPQTNVSKIKVSQKFSITTDAYPDKIFYGKIYAVNPKIDEASRSLVVRGIIDNSKRMLRPGLFAQIKLDTGKPEKALFIPESAVSLTANSKTVFLYKKGAAIQTKITTGRRIPGWVEVTKGLNQSDTILVKGQDKIKDGDQVSPVGTSK